MATCVCGNETWSVPFRAKAAVTVGGEDEHVVMTVQDGPGDPKCDVCDRAAPPNARTGILEAAQRLARSLPPVSLRPTYTEPKPPPPAAPHLRVVSSSSST